MTISGKTDFRAVKTSRAYEQIVEQIESAIADGSLSAGERLPSERDMMERFSVSRPTVREALRVLEAMGLIRSRHGDPNGSEILPPSADLLTRPISSLVRTGNLRLSDFVPIRMLLEGFACTLAAHQRTDAHLARMDSAVARMSEVVTGNASTDQFGLAEVEFHQAIWDASGNGLVGLFNKSTQGLMLEMILGKIDSDASGLAVMAVSRDHDAEILEAIRSGDPDLAGTLSRRYIFDYYGDSVPEDERAFLQSLVDSSSSTGLTS